MQVERKLFVLLLSLSLLGCTFNNSGSTSSEYSCNVVQTSHGSTIIEPVKQFYNYGDTIKITFYPDTKYQFVKWSSNTKNAQTFSTNNPFSFSITDDTIITPYTNEMYSITTQAVTNGIISISPNKNYYSKDDIITVTAVPNNLYSFSSWFGSLSGSTNPQMISVNSDLNIGATFSYSPLIDITCTPIKTEIYTGTGTEYYWYIINFSCSNIGNVPAKITQFDISLYSKINDPGSGYSVNEKTISFTFGNYMNALEVVSGSYHAYCLYINNVHAYKINYTFTDGSTVKTNTVWGSI